MAIYHLAVKSVSRSSGRSAVAAIAYRAGVELVNERDGLVHDYTRRGGVEDVFIVVPEGAEWAQDRSALWNAAEAAEKRKDAKVRSEEHTSELQSLMRISYAVFCLKKKKKLRKKYNTIRDRQSLNYYTHSTLTNT